MIKVYQAVPGAIDKLLGHVSEGGRVYLSKAGPDEHVGEVNLATGKIFHQRFGPDKHIGNVNLETGKVFSRRFGPDKYVGNVDVHGRMHRAVAMAADEYVGKVDPFLSYAHSAAALLLLVLPSLEPETHQDKHEGSKKKEE